MVVFHEEWPEIGTHLVKENQLQGQPRESEKSLESKGENQLPNPKVISIGPNLFNLSLNLENLSVFQAMVCKSISSFSYAMQ